MINNNLKFKNYFQLKHFKKKSSKKLSGKFEKIFRETESEAFNPPHEVKNNRAISKGFIFFIFLVCYKKTSNNKKHYTSWNKYIGHVKDIPEPGKLSKKEKNDDEKIKEILKVPEEENTKLKKSSSIEESILNKIRQWLIIT